MVVSTAGRVGSNYQWPLWICQRGRLCVNPCMDCYNYAHVH